MASFESSYLDLILVGFMSFHHFMFCRLLGVRLSTSVMMTTVVVKNTKKTKTRNLAIILVSVSY